MKLYEIDPAIDALIEKLIDPETGEITDTSAIEALEMEKATKIENLACYIKNLTADAAAYKAEKDAFAARQTAAENQAKRMKDYLSFVLHGENFESARCKISFRATPPSVSILDMGTVVEWLETHGYEDAVKYEDPTVSKTELKRIMATEPVPGAELVSGLSMGVK